ncbi:hypothetical protein [Engelhardtia mirabilis]|uniref:Right handed beta helix domain-containing protein n=1 Tax=Engelhardtia mirabilis TaxID=2528011 RepID=A0A518BGS8_9BACT|nr:hypothetical protein Pla133_12200 [Planctomycetes bacterium Pla133]QDV00481.1 hypothetical protein Pla86_12200 [Planctomycetes bacterium Pla86]
MPSIQVLALTSMFAFPAAALALGQVHVVDASGAPGAFTDLQEAIFAAQDGDLILVEDGTYSSFTISAKGLTIVADTGAAPVVVGRAEISGTAAGQDILIRGLELRTPLFEPGSSVTSTLGTVEWVDCVIRNGNIGQGFAPEGLALTDCAQVVFAGCELRGSPAGFPGAGSGLESFNAFVQAYDSLFQGAQGALGELGHGGHGARVTGGVLFASGCTFAPGDGGNGVTISTQFMTKCKDAGDGGSGILLEPSATIPVPAFLALDCTFGAGDFGKATLATCVDGVPGQEIELLAGVHLPLPGTARSSVASSPVRFGGQVQLDLTGEGGDLVLLAVALGPGSVPLAGELDPFVVDPITSVFTLLGALPASGEQTFSFPVASVPGAAGVNLWLQGLYLSTGLELFLGAPSATSLIPASF